MQTQLWKYPYIFILCYNVAGHKFFRAAIILNQEERQHPCEEREVPASQSCCLLLVITMLHSLQSLPLESIQFLQVQAGFLGRDKSDCFIGSTSLYSLLMKLNGNDCVNTLPVITDNHTHHGCFLAAQLNVKLLAMSGRGENRTQRKTRGRDRLSR